MGWTWNGIEYYCVPNTAQDSTLRPSGTLLFSGLPMMKLVKMYLLTLWHFDFTRKIAWQTTSVSTDICLQIFSVKSSWFMVMSSSTNPPYLPVHTASFWNITIQCTFHDDLTEKTVLPKLPMIMIFFCQMAKIKTTSCDFTEKLLVSNFIGWPNLQIILEAKSMNESSWNFFSIISFLFYFLQIKSFPPWMACFNSNINDLDFVTKNKLKLVKIVANWGHSRWKGLKLQKIE